MTSHVTIASNNRYATITSNYSHFTIASKNRYATITSNDSHVTITLNDPYVSIDSNNSHVAITSSDSHVIGKPTPVRPRCRATLERLQMKKTEISMANGLVVQRYL